MKSKEEYIDHLHKKIDDWNADIDTLMVKTERIDRESRTELHDQIQKLKVKRDEIERKINTLSQSGAEAWGDIKSGLDLAGEAMSTAVNSATTRFFSRDSEGRNEQ
ncbi:MAG: hypothetical protein WBB19_15150 [Desulforhopalus sp.]